MGYGCWWSLESCPHAACDIVAHLIALVVGLLVFECLLVGQLRVVISLRCWGSCGASGMLVLSVAGVDRLG